MKLGKKINKMEKVRKIKYSNKNQRGIIKIYIYIRGQEIIKERMEKYRSLGT